MMRFSRLAVILFSFFVVASVMEARQQEESKTTASKPEPSAPQDQTPAKAVESGPAVDAAKVTGSTFESQYFKFTYELPAGWKALDDAARVAANRLVLEQDKKQAASHIPIPKRTTNKPPAKRNPVVVHASAAPEPDRYSLMVASPNGVDSIASPVLPRINVWAHKRVPPLDSAAYNAQFLLSGKRTQVLAMPQDVQLDGHPFVRVDVIAPDGIFRSRFVTVMGDYLVGFDFRAESARGMMEMENTTKSIKFK